LTRKPPYQLTAPRYGDDTLPSTLGFESAAPISLYVTATEALEAHGFSWEQLEKLARKALADAMKRTRIRLDEDRLHEAHDYLVEKGALLALRYDPAKSNGLSFVTYAYRIMRLRFIDYLRLRHGDARRVTPVFEVTVAEMPAQYTVDEAEFDWAVESLAGGLGPRARWAFDHLARPSAGGQFEVDQAAKAASLEAGEAETMLAELGRELVGVGAVEAGRNRPRPPYLGHSPPVGG